MSTSLGRERFWAGSAPEAGGVISFVLADGRAGECSIEQAIPSERYQLRYFGRTLTFTLAAGEAGGTDLTLSADDSADPADCAEVVSLLLRLKASVDFGVDLRNHDTARTTEYADS